MDDVVGAGPEEHLMSDSEHMKTSLYLTDVVVLRHEGDIVNFLGLEINKTRKGFEVKNSKDLVESILNLYGLQNSNRQSILVDARQWWSSRQQLHLMVTNTPTFAQQSENSSSCHLGDQTCNLPSNNYPHKSSIPRQRASAQWNKWYGISKARNTLVFFLNRAKWFKQVCWTDCSPHRHWRLYTNTVSSLPLSSLLFFSSSAYPQTDTAQLYNTHPDSCTHMDRTCLEFNLSSVSLQNKNCSHCHLDVIRSQSSETAGLLKPQIYEDATGLWTVMAAGTESLDAELLKDLRGLGKPPSFDGNDAEYQDFRFSFRIHMSLVGAVSQALMVKCEIERNPIFLAAVRSIHTWSVACRCTVHCMRWRAPTLSWAMQCDV